MSNELRLPTRLLRRQRVRHRRLRKRHWWSRPVIWLETKLESVADALREWALLDVLDRLSRLGLLVALITWFAAIPARRAAQERELLAQEETVRAQRAAAEAQRKQKIFQAWQALSLAQGKPGSGGRAYAIADLLAEGESVRGIDVSGGAHLDTLVIENRDATYANFSDASLRLPILRGTRMSFSNLDRVKIDGDTGIAGQLYGASMAKCDFGGSTMNGAALFRVDMSDADLLEVDARNARFAQVLLNRGSLFRGDFTGTMFDSVDFVDASLAEADFSNAHFSACDFTRADLSGANLKGTRFTSNVYTKMRGANLAQVKNISPAFIWWAVNEQDAIVFENDAEVEELRRDPMAYREWRQRWKAGRQQPTDASCPRELTWCR